ncbi:MAG: GDP-mannose 4,6-dehydratase, partial [Polyangiaceae bacterium]
LSTGKRDNLAAFRDDERLTIVVSDVADGIFAPLADIARTHGRVTRIIHLAAQIDVVTSVQSPLFDVRQNLGATVHVLEYARCAGVDRVVFASSAAIYGDVDEVPVPEAAPKAPLSPYGLNKLGSEGYLRYYRQVHGVSTAALRFFNVYGPRQDPKSPYSGVISIFMDRSMRGDDIVIFGDGEQTRDFVYVGDVADAILAACFVAEAPSGAVNVGTGKETTINQLASVVCELHGGKSRVAHAEARPGEILRSCADVSAAKAALGFEAKVAIAEGLRETAAWLKG